MAQPCQHVAPIAGTPNAPSFEYPKDVPNFDRFIERVEQVAENSGAQMARERVELVVRYADRFTTDLIRGQPTVLRVLNPPAAGQQAAAQPSWADVKEELLALFPRTNPDATVSVLGLEQWCNGFAMLASPTEADFAHFDLHFKYMYRVLRERNLCEESEVRRRFSTAVQ